MVKAVSLFLVIFLVVILTEVFIIDPFFNIEDPSKLTANSILDGALTAGGTNVSLTILASAPVITINKPKNITFENNQSIDLDLSVFNETSPISTLFYNLDDGTNISLTFFNDGNITTFATSFGSHTLKVFANETVSGVMGFANVTFSVNTSIIFQIIYETFKEGATTDFDSLTRVQLEAIDAMTLENITFGKIVFEETINITADNLTDVAVNLDKHVNISSFIFINETVFPNLEGKSASLYFYNITFANPEVLRNGATCPSSICIAQSLTGQTLAVNVSNFSTYSVQEGDAPSGPAGGGGGGSGGGGGGASGDARASVLVDLDLFNKVTTSILRQSKLSIIWEKERYSIRISPKTRSSIEISVPFAGLTFTMNLGDKIELDLDNDNVPDISIHLIEMPRNALVFTIARLDSFDFEFPRKPSVEKPSKEKEIISADVTPKIESKTSIIVIIVLIALFLVGLVSVRNRKMFKSKRK